MAGTVAIATTVTIVDLRGKTRTFTFTAPTASVTAITEMDFAITANQTRIIWDPTVAATENVADFDRMILVADGNLDIEMTINEGDVNEELLSFRLTQDIPFMLGADDAYYNHSASDIYAGTLDVIDKIRVDEPAGAARNLKMILAT